MKEVKFQQFRPNLNVTDLIAGVEFYVKIIGFELVHSDASARFALLSKDGVELVLLEIDKISPQSAYLYVDCADKMYHHCTANDININIPLTAHEYGIKDFTFIDLFENMISIGERI